MEREGAQVPGGERARDSRSVGGGRGREWRERQERGGEREGGRESVWENAHAPRTPLPTLSPTDPVPRGPLTLAACLAKHAARPRARESGRARERERARGAERETSIFEHFDAGHAAGEGGRLVQGHLFYRLQDALLDPLRQRQSQSCSGHGVILLVLEGLEAAVLPVAECLVVVGDVQRLRAPPVSDQTRFCGKRALRTAQKRPNRTKETYLAGGATWRGERPPLRHGLPTWGARAHTCGQQRSVQGWRKKRGFLLCVHRSQQLTRKPRKTTRAVM